ncbi:MAG: hypothetical protein CEE40_04365 [Chloroflexi bacterium B3_Chlor]|nr:MAG: hypothetical protein CEE40_04365 [Chloroflexi bacterium B3_Chlor]
MVAIGVTGHRYLAELGAITAGVDRALGRIEETFPSQPLTIISPLAEGADRLMAREVLARSAARLVVPLPLPQSDYIADFEADESKEAFLALLDRADEVITLPPAPTRDQAYAAAGRYVLDHCDALVAIWDGQMAQGPGGTGDIVVQARRRGLPLAWIRASNRRPDTVELTTPNEEQGKVSFEGFPEHSSRPEERDV